MAAQPASGAAPASKAAMPAAALPLAVRDGELVVAGFPGGAPSTLLTGLAPTLTSRGGGKGEDGCLILGLDLGSGARPLAQADVAVGQVGGAGAPAEVAAAPAASFRPAVLAACAHPLAAWRCPIP